MFEWLRKRAGERKAGLEEQRRRAEKTAALESQRKRKLHQCKRNVMDVLDSGHLPRMKFTVDGGGLPFKFQRSEHLLWVFSSVEYLEQKTRREIAGRSAGTSIRVAKGVSFRVGRSRGTPVEYDEVVRRGVGLLAVTTKHVYFSGERRSLRIPFGKIVSVERLEDGVGITRDRASGHPEFFLVGREDADFACDLIHAVPSFEASPRTEVLSIGEYHLYHDGSGSPDGDFV